MNVTQDNLHYSSRKDFVPGADLGLFFRFTPCRIYFQPEINYIIRKENIYLQGFEVAEIKYKEETNYIDIPLFVGIKAIDFKQFKIRFFTGPNFCFALREYGFNYFQLGFQAGLGLDIWRFTIDASYSFLGYTQWIRKYSNIIKVGVGFKCF